MPKEFSELVVAWDNASGSGECARTLERQTLVRDAHEMLEAYRPHDACAEVRRQDWTRMSRYSADPRQEYLGAVELVLAPLLEARVMRTPLKSIPRFGGKHQAS